MNGQSNNKRVAKHNSKEAERQGKLIAKNGQDE